MSLFRRIELSPPPPSRFCSSPTCLGPEHCRSSLFTGAYADGTYSLLSGVLACWLAAALCIAAAVSFSVWGAQRGLAGAVSRTVLAPSRSAAQQYRFGKDPLNHKEFLWFVRDRSAIVQSILIPLTVAGFQLFNLRGLW